MKLFFYHMKQKFVKNTPVRHLKKILKNRENNETSAFRQVKAIFKYVSSLKHKTDLLCR